MSDCLGAVGWCECDRRPCPECGGEGFILVESTIPTADIMRPCPRGCAVPERGEP